MEEVSHLIVTGPEAALGTCERWWITNWKEFKELLDIRLRKPFNCLNPTLSQQGLPAEEEEIVQPEKAY